MPAIRSPLRPAICSALRSPLDYNFGGFKPASLYVGATGIAWDLSNFSTMFQDSAGTTPVTAVTQPVGRINCAGGTGNSWQQATAGSRPTLQIDGSGKYYLSLDGTNDFMQTGATIDFTATDKMTSCLGFTVSSAVAITVEHGADVGANNGSFYVAASQDPAANGLTSAARAVGARDSIKAPTSTYTAGTLLVATQQIDLSIALSTSKMSVYLNGSAIAMTVNSEGADTAGNFGNYTMYMGARAGTSVFHNGRIYSGIIVGRSRTTAERVQIESWVNARTGAF